MYISVFPDDVTPRRFTTLEFKKLFFICLKALSCELDKIIFFSFISF